EQRLEKITHVRRNLFGPTDNEQLQQDFQDMLCDSMKEAQQKWSFDFLQDAPVEGVVQWEKLDENEVPAFYHSCVVRRAQRPLQLLNHQSHHPAQVALSEKPKKTENNRVSEGKKIKQTSLTGYYSAMKKVKKNMKATAKMST
ncbi:CDN1A inhibitor, partial [Bucco capensis]|nr:CDN1A inhibitor [Bucco capensis]